MKSWEKHYAKLKNNKWETYACRDEDDELDEDEKYLLEERLEEMSEDGFHQCPRCDEMNFFDSETPYCTECSWSVEDDEFDNCDE